MDKYDRLVIGVIVFRINVEVVRGERRLLYICIYFEHEEKPIT